MPTLNTQQRAAIVRAARDWLGTPYHHRAAVKHAGADCAMFPVAVFKQCSVLPASYRPPEYSSQWHLHRSEELYLREIKRFANEIAGPPLPADFVVFKFGRTFSHGAIVLDWPLIIHSYIPHGVTLADALCDGAIIGREMKFFGIDSARNRTLFTTNRPWCNGILL
jgi:cell wall-associated NlpC family hydrolase